MKKQLISLLLAAIMATSLLPATAWAEAANASGQCGADGGNVTWTLDSDGLMTISGTGEMADYTKDSYAPWYEQRSSIRALAISNGITNVGAYAFFECTNLSDVTLSSDTINIGSGAFSRCNGLNSVVIPASVTSIGSSAFQACTSLSSVTIPDSVESIGYHAFSWCDLTNITISANVSSIGSGAFGLNSNLRGIWVEEDNPNYSSDSYGVLFNKDKTKLLCCPGGFTGSYRIPASVRSFDDRPFYDCRSLTDVTIPDGVESIGDYMFTWCTSLASITIPNSVTTIGYTAFNKCDSLTDVYYGGNTAQWNSISIGSNNSNLTTAALHLKGDLNNSGRDADVGDVQCLYAYLTGAAIPDAYADDSSTFLLLADINGDGFIDVYDLQRLYEAVSGVTPF